MIIVCIAAMVGFLISIPAAIRHDQDLPISHTGKASK